MPAPGNRGDPAAAEPFRIELRRIIARPVEEVYRAWTTPALIARWFSPGIEEMEVSAEVRPGGPIRIELTSRGAPWRLDGKYLEVVPGKRLRFTWVTTECPAAVGSVVTVDFRDLGGRTELVLLHEGFPDRKTRDDHDATGWRQILEVFVVAGGGVLTPERFADASRAVLARGRGPTG